MYAIPWWGKITGKIVLSRLPFGYGLWQKLGLFRHGYMDRVDYVQGVFGRHVDAASLRGQLRDKTVLELGPGDSIATALLAACHGARAVLLDVGAFAVKDVRIYQAMAKNLESQGLCVPPEIYRASSFSDVLSACGAVYLTNGLEDFSRIDSGSVDLIFSQAVLEHVRRKEFADIMRECRRVISPVGAASHTVDLRDHLGGGLNNLRFSERMWESNFFASSGFYTNRIQFSDMLSFFKAAGFSCEITNVTRWAHLPIDRRSLASEFQDVADDELTVSGFGVLLRPI